MLFPMPVIVGAPRSGTTLLRFMLDAHTELAIPPETGFLALCAKWLKSPEVSPEKFIETISGFPPGSPIWPDFGIDKEVLSDMLDQNGCFKIAPGIRAFYRAYANRFNKPRYGDKTPNYCFHISAIHELLPETRFIHLIREGRDVALSWRKTWFAPGQAISTLAQAWRQHIESAREQVQRNAVPVLEIRYEALITQPRLSLQRICDYIELPYSDQMLRYYQTAAARLVEHGPRFDGNGALLVTHDQRLTQQALTLTPPSADRIGVWRREMMADEVREFEEDAGELLSELGYQREGL
ncbi:MAG: sulfotransferase [Methylobacter sp.]|nr:sulfotransferase [Methylobacter sp.]